MKKETTDSGAKAHQRDDLEDRALLFKLWHRDLDPSLYSTDIDQIEWRSINGRLTPVAVYEITRIDGDADPPPAYYESILKRFEERDMQADSVVMVARALKTKPYIILYHKNLKRFHVYDFGSKTWYHYNEPRMVMFIEKLPYK